MLRRCFVYRNKLIDARRRWEAGVSEAIEANKAVKDKGKENDFKRVFVNKDFTPVKKAFPLSDAERWEGLPPTPRTPVAVQPEDPHVVRATFIGPPNVGKSELVNTLATAHVSAKSDREHTTEKWVKAVTRVHGTQLLLLDTPGVFIPRNKIDKLKMPAVNAAWDSLQLADVAVAVIAGGEPFSPTTASFLVTMNERAIAHELPLVLAITKMDKVQSFAKHQELHQHFRNNIELLNLKIDTTMEMSAEHFSGIVGLKDHLARYGKPRQWTHHISESSTLSPVEKADQILREVFTTFLPTHFLINMKHEIIGWTTGQDGKVLMDVELYFMGQNGNVFWSNIEKISTETRRLLQIQQKTSFKVTWFPFLVPVQRKKVPK